MYELYFLSALAAAALFPVSPSPLGVKQCRPKGRLVWGAREMIGRNCGPAHLGNRRVA
jgi:hypothetical protein